MARPDYDFDLLNELRVMVQQLASDYGLREDELWPEVCALEEEIRPSRSSAKQAGARRAQLQWRPAEMEKVRGLLDVEDDFPTAISETAELLQRTVFACVVKLCAFGAVCRTCSQPLDARDETNPVVVRPEGLLHRDCADDEDEACVEEDGDDDEESDEDDGEGEEGLANRWDEEEDDDDIDEERRLLLEELDEDSESLARSDDDGWYYDDDDVDELDENGDDYSDDEE